MGYNILIYKNDNIKYLTGLLESFEKNINNLNNVSIYIISDDDKMGYVNEMLSNFKELNVNLFSFKHIVFKHSNIKINEKELYQTVGKDVYLSIKKYYGLLSIDGEDEQIFIINKGFILRRINIEDLFNSYFRNKYLLTYKNELKLQIGKIEKQLEEYHCWMYEKKIIRNMDIYYSKNLKHPVKNNEFSFEQEYLNFINKHEYNYGYKIFDLLKLLQIYLSASEYKYVNSLNVNRSLLLLFNYMIDNTFNNDSVSHPRDIVSHDDIILKLKSVMIEIGCNTILPITNNRKIAEFILQTPQIYIYSKHDDILFELMKINFFNPNSYAICVSGRLYNIEGIHELKKFIGTMKTDNIVHLWVEKRNNHYCRDIENILRPKVSKFSESLNTYQSSLVKYPQHSRKKEFDYNVFSMFNGIYQCNKLKEKIEARLNKKYDLVIRVRPDLVYTNITLIDILFYFVQTRNCQRFNSSVFIPEIYNSVGCNDQFAISCSKIMDIYSNLYQWLQFAAKMYVFNPEYLLFKYLDENNVNVRHFHIDYTILWHSSIMKTVWWRSEIPETNSDNLHKFLQAKTESFSSIYKLGLDTNMKKFHIKNIIYDMYLYVDVIHKSIYGVKQLEKATIFYITSATPTRVNIKHENLSLINQNGRTNWNLYTTPDDDTLFVNGNDKEWAQFYLITKNNAYYFQIYHRLANISCEYGRYLYMDKEGNIYTDGNYSELSKWDLIEVL